MKKLILSMFLVMLFSGGVSAESGDIECTAGNCEGWHVWYETESMSNEFATIHFGNESGKTAFNIKGVVLFYTYMGEYLDRFEMKKEGPVQSNWQMKYKVKFPKGASKLTCEIYWSDKYTGDTNSESK